MTADTLIAPDNAPTSVLDRLALLVSAFEGSSSLTLTEIVERTGLPRSSIHRMLNRLVAMQWLCRTDRTYQLGYRFVELGLLARQQDALHRAALPLMHELHRITGMIVHLGVLEGRDVLYVEKVGGVLGTAVPTRVGGRLPAGRSAIGRVLLAYADHAVGPEGQWESLAGVRDSGIATESEQAFRGFSCVAAPIGPVGSPVAALSLCGPVQRMRFDHRMVDPVRMTAATVWKSMNQSFGPVEIRRSMTALQVRPSAPAVSA